ncbi:hypothetical protein PG997_014480 [Apiospora hydei]|uniref:Uncharacterized protein n=1 Tax=Apiospora hydei TaxID=1337664 RepID=A0ABR1UTY5_9PEZI
MSRAMPWASVYIVNVVHIIPLSHDVVFTAAHLSDGLELGEQHVSSPAPGPIRRVPAPVPTSSAEIVRSPIAYFAARGAIITAQKSLKLRKETERSRGKGRRHGFTPILHHLVLVINVRPKPAHMVYMRLNKPHGPFDVGDIGTKPFEILGPGDVEPNRLDQLHIARYQKHIGIGDAIFTVAPYVIFAAAIRLQRARGTPELARVFAGQAKIELDHPAYHCKIEGAARCNAPLHLELMVDVGIRSLIFVGQCTDDITLGDRVLGGGCALNDARQHGAPVKASERIGETAGAGEIERKFVAMNVRIRSRSVLCQVDQGSVGGEMAPGKTPAAAVALEQNVRCIAWQDIVAISTIEKKDQTGREVEDEIRLS